MWTFQKQLLLLSRQDWCPEHVNSLCLRNVGNYRPSLVTAQQETVVLVQITVITSIHIKALVYAGNCLVVYCSASVPCEVLICWIHKAFWDTTPCRLVNCYRHFGGDYCLHLQGSVLGLFWRWTAVFTDAMKAIYQSAWRRPRRLKP